MTARPDSSAAALDSGAEEDSHPGGAENGYRRRRRSPKLANVLRVAVTVIPVPDVFPVPLVFLLLSERRQGDSGARQFRRLKILRLSLSENRGLISELMMHPRGRRRRRRNRRRHAGDAHRANHCDRDVFLPRRSGLLRGSYFRCDHNFVFSSLGRSFPCAANAKNAKMMFFFFRRRRLRKKEATRTPFCCTALSATLSLSLSRTTHKACDACVRLYRNAM